MLPELIFFTGVPGSRWSGIAREIKEDPSYDTTDRAPHREFIDIIILVATKKHTLVQEWNLIQV